MNVFTSQLRQFVVFGISLALLVCVLPCCESGRREAASSEGTVGKKRNQITVVCTTSMIADLARIVGGDRAKVTGLMGPGVDPHLYMMTREDQKRLIKADLVLYHGLHLEGKMVGFLRGLEERARGERNQVVVAVAATVPEDRLIQNELFGEYPDPHVWFDLKLWKVVTRRAVEAFGVAIPGHKTDFEKRGEDYLAELDRLDSWARKKAEEIPHRLRKIVTSHDAYNYFARAYGFEVKGLQGISTETQAGLKDIEEAVKYIQKYRIPVIFAETSVSPADVERVAASTPAEVCKKKLYSDALGRAGSPEGTLLGMFRYNVETIVESLGRELGT